MLYAEQSAFLAMSMLLVTR